jgi:hypothetical protein
MRNRLFVSVAFGATFLVASGVSPVPAGTDAGATFTYPALASAAGTCSLAPLVCANDSAPGCEIICGGMQQAVCVEGSCSAAGNIVAANKCSCK